MRAFFASIILLITAEWGISLDPIPDGDWKKIRPSISRLTRALQAQSGPLNSEELQKLKTLAKMANPGALQDVQKLLDPHCLVRITINPESRVKVARGSASAILKLKVPRIFLIKIENAGAIREGLSVHGEGIIPLRGRQNKDQWLNARLIYPQPLKKNLSGERLEYVLMQLTALEQGKREVTFRFDAGQGTQDLGFRAEVPILFRAHP